jgi:hypothetical protein
MGKNEILRTTGSKDKPVIFNTINFLKEAKIIESKKFKKGKKGSISLSPLGKEIVDLITDIHLSSDAHIAVETKISEYLPLVEEEFLPMQNADEYDWNYPSKKLRKNLLQKGWKHEELDSFDEVIQSLYEVGDIYRKSIFNSLLHRYSTILSKFQVNKNAKAVLSQIILDKVSNLLNSGPVRNEIKPSFSDAYHFGFRDLQIPILKDIEQRYKNPHRIISNRFTSDEITRLTSSLLCVLKPSVDELISFIGVYSDLLWMEKRIENIKSSKQDKGIEKQAESYLHNLKELDRSRMKCVKRYNELMIEDEELIRSGFKSLVKK